MSELDLFAEYTMISRHTLRSLTEPGEDYDLSNQIEILDHSLVKPEAELGLVLCIYNSNRETLSAVRGAVSRLNVELRSRSTEIRYLDNANQIQFIQSLTSLLHFSDLPALMAGFLGLVVNNHKVIKRLGWINFCSAIALYAVLHKVKQDYKTVTPILFTSNNRLSEIVRTWAVISECSSIEVLHGISTKNFGEYYSRINSRANANAAKLGYVNMSKDLPQPASVASGVILQDGQKALFPNSLIGEKREIRNRVIVVGGSVGDDINSYVNSKYFDNDRSVLCICSAMGRGFLYVCHPKLGLAVADALGLASDDASVGIRDLKFTNCILVGHFSTALFEHDETNQVLILNDGLEQLGDEMKGIAARFERISVENFHSVIAQKINKQDDV